MASSVFSTIKSRVPCSTSDLFSPMFSPVELLTIGSGKIVRMSTGETTSAAYTLECGKQHRQTYPPLRRLQQNGGGLRKSDVQVAAFSGDGVPAPEVAPFGSVPGLGDYQRGGAREIGVVAQAFFEITGEDAECSILHAPGCDVHGLVQVDLA